MSNPVNLAIDTFAVSLREFTLNGYERIVPPVGGEVEYSLNGTPIVDGQLYEPKYVWTLSAFLSEAEWRQLWLIYRRSERKRSLDQPFGITIADYVEVYVEDQEGRSRALAPDGEVIALEGGGLEYPALFEARMYEPRWEHSNNLLYPYIARCVLRELDIVPAEASA